MSFANQFGKLFNRKPAPAEAEAGAEGNSDLLSAESPDAGTSRDPYQVEPMNSVQGDVDSYAPGSDDTDFAKRCDCINDWPVAASC